MPLSKQLTQTRRSASIPPSQRKIRTCLLGRVFQPSSLTLSSPLPRADLNNRAPGGFFTLHPLTALSAVWVMPNHTPTEALALLLRWTHFIAGITSVRLLDYFTPINI